MRVSEKLTRLYFVTIIIVCIITYTIIKTSSIKTNKITVTLQFIDSCNDTKLAKEVIQKAIQKYGNRIIYREVKVKDSTFAREISFRGSPTILIDSVDLENMPEVKSASLSCRTYKNGFPSIKKIQDLIDSKLDKKPKLIPRRKLPLEQ